MYGAVFWGVRLCLQAVFDVKPHLTAWWLTAGYHTLTVLFLSFTAVYGYAALRLTTAPGSGTPAGGGRRCRRG